MSPLRLVQVAYLVLRIFPRQDFAVVVIASDLVAVAFHGDHVLVVRAGADAFVTVFSQL